MARVRLIRELRHDLEIEEETLPVVLSLLDQLYANRRRLRALSEAVAAEPAETRARVLRAYREALRRDVEVKEAVGQPSGADLGQHVGPEEALDRQHEEDRRQ